jgi:hypothetical protein
VAVAIAIIDARSHRRRVRISGFAADISIAGHLKQILGGATAIAYIKSVH